MSVRTIWIVRDPGPLSTLADVCHEQDVEGLGDYVLGAEAAHPGAWAVENHAVHLDAAAARADAVARLALRDARAQASRVAERIAREELRISTLDVRNSDSKDFHDVGVHSLRAALERAYVQGARDALEKGNG